MGDSSLEPALHPTDRQLVRAIGTRALAASAVNLTVGGGIFVLPGIVAASDAAISLGLLATVAVAQTTWRERLGVLLLVTAASAVYLFRRPRAAEPVAPLSG